ncbi:MAG: hypothetical protein ACREBC_17375 [Pyrinomonadaceae bacterium]
MTGSKAFSDAVDEAQMETQRLEISPAGIDSNSIAVRKQRFPQMPSRGLDLKKNLLPPLREKFVLDIPFHRTAEETGNRAIGLNRQERQERQVKQFTDRNGLQNYRTSA